MANENTNSDWVYGLDLGTSKMVLCGATLQRFTTEIVPNELGHLSTPSVVALGTKKREIGEGAVSKLRVDPANTIGNLTELISSQLSDLGQQTYGLQQSAEGRLVVGVSQTGNPTSLETDQILAMVFGKLSRDVDRHLVSKSRAAGDQAGQNLPRLLTVAVPSFFEDSHLQTIVDAARISQKWSVQIVSSNHALVQTYVSKNRDFRGQLAICDMGSHNTSICIAQVSEGGAYVISHSVTQKGLGGAAVDSILFEFFAAQVLAKHGQSPPLASRGGQRLLAACERLKTMLSSGVPEAKVEVDNVLPDTDHTFILSKPQFDELTAPLCSQLEALLGGVVSREGVKVDFVELVGGGMRMAPFQNVVRTAISSDVRFTLDSTSAVAIGASTLAWIAATTSLEQLQQQLQQQQQQQSAAEGDQQTPTPAQPQTPAALASILLALGQGGRASEDELNAKRQVEQQFEARDEEVNLIGHKRNELESALLAVRQAQSGKHKKLLDPSKIQPIIDKVEEWLDYSDDASPQDYDSEITKLNTELNAAAPEYYAAIVAERAEVERQLEEAAEERRREEEVEGAQDHDTRKLKKADRMALVQKNKAEATELFKGGNIEHAAMRYAKALSHCDKFFDLSDADKAEVKELELSLHLNLAMCYLKLEQWRKAVRKCDDALSIDANNTKAHFRKAQALLPLKSLDEALAAAEKAADLDPNDAAIKTLLAKCRAMKKKEADDAKAVYKKMFG